MGKYLVFYTSLLKGSIKAPMLVDEFGMGMRMPSESQADEKSASLNRSNVATIAPRYNSAS